MIAHLKRAKCILGRMRNSLTLKPHVHKKAGSLENFSSISYNSINLAGFMELTGQVDKICPLFRTTRLTIIKSPFWIRFSDHFFNWYRSVQNKIMQRRTQHSCQYTGFNVTLFKVYAVSLSDACVYYIRNPQGVSLDYFTKSAQNNFGRKFVCSFSFCVLFYFTNMLRQKQVNNNIQQSQWQRSGACKYTWSLCYHTGFRSPAKHVLQKTSWKYWQLVNTQKL